MQILFEWIERAHLLALGDFSFYMDTSKKTNPNVGLLTGFLMPMNGRTHPSIHPSACMRQQQKKEANSLYLASQILGPTCQVHLV